MIGVHGQPQFQQNGAMKYNGLVDIGVNLTHRRFDADRGEVIERAAAAGVDYLVVTGVSATQSAEALALAGRDAARRRATVGVHPHHASDWAAAGPAALESLLAHPVAAAVGETGLDYNRDFAPRAVQREAFAGQLGLAARLGRPVFLHQRDAEADFLAILAEYRPHLSAAVLHCFTGDAGFLAASLELDLHIGITGWICDERRGGALRECIGAIPAERLMIETDAPFLLPRDLAAKPRDRRNEPAYLGHVLETVAALRGESAGALAATTAATSRAFFGFN